MTCTTCGKPNWAGCGAHVEMVLADVPRADRCRCREGVKPTTKSLSKPIATATAGKPVATEDASTVDRFKKWLRQ